MGGNKILASGVSPKWVKRRKERDKQYRNIICRDKSITSIPIILDRYKFSLFPTDTDYLFMDHIKQIQILPSVINIKQKTQKVQILPIFHRQLSSIIIALKKKQMKENLHMFGHILSI